ncbi:hypothetical protein MMC12_006675 [Toensbergia leucococca]|nr:hypothetical protein [Toensbergia leucococca]
MLRRKPTAITLTSEDLTAYEDSRAMRQLQYENKSLDGTRQVETAHSDAMQGNRQGVVDPNDELKPLPGDKARVGRSGMNWHSPQDDYPKLKSWLFNEDLAHDRVSLSVSLGQNGSFFAVDNQGHRWRNIPESCCDYYQKYTRADLFAKSRINSVDIGHNGSYLGIGVDNRWFWNLGNEYPALSLMVQQKGITSCDFSTTATFVTINPFASNQHFAVFADGTAHWSLPPAWVSDMQALFQKYANETNTQTTSVGQTAQYFPSQQRPSLSNRMFHRPSSNTSFTQPQATSPQMVSSPGGSSLDFNQAMQVAQSSLDAINNTEGTINNGAQLMNGLASNGLMVGQMMSQANNTMAGCQVM